MAIIYALMGQLCFLQKEIFCREELYFTYKSKIIKCNKPIKNTKFI